MESTTNNWSKTTRYIAGVGLALFGLFILYWCRPAYPLLIVAGLTAMIVQPIISWLYNRIHLPRALAVGLVYSALVIIVPLIVFMAMPAILNTGKHILNLDYNTMIQHIIAWLRSALLAIKALPMPVEGLKQYIDQVADSILTTLDHTPIPQPGLVSLDSIFRSLNMALSTTVHTATSVAGFLSSSFAMLMFIFWASVSLNLNAHTFHSSLLRAVPERYQPEIAVLIARIERTWGSFLIGQLVLMLFTGVAIWLGLTILGVPGAPYLGLLAGLLEIIPGIGIVISTIPAIIVAVLLGSTSLPVNNILISLLVIMLYTLVPQIKNSLLAPRVMGKAVHLPTLVVMIVLWVGVKVGGLSGVLIATPMAASIWEIIRYIYHKTLGENPFPPEEPTQPVRSASLWKKRNWIKKFIIKKSNL